MKNNGSEEVILLETGYNRNNKSNVIRRDK